MNPLNHTTPRIFRGSPHFYERVMGARFGLRPLDFLSINMPPVCNYRCQMCLSGMNGRQNETRAERLDNIRDRGQGDRGQDGNPDRDQLARTPLTPPRGPLTRPELECLISEARELGAIHVEISGEGEPLAYRQTVEDVITLARWSGMHTTVFTNGSLLTRGFLSLLSQNNASLAISLDYMDPARYERFSGREHSFSRVMENISLARSVLGGGIEYRGHMLHRLAIHSIALADNSHDLERIRELCENDPDGQVIFYSIAPVMNRGNALANPQIVPHDQLPAGRDPDGGESSAGIIARLSHGSLIHCDSSVPGLGRPVCGTFQYGIGIRYDGEALFDAHAYDTAGLFGNIRDTWLSTMVTRVRQAQETYHRGYSDGGFCPLRDPNFTRFVRDIRTRRGQQRDR